MDRKRNVKRILFWLILILAVILRYIQFGTFPPVFPPVYFETWKYSQVSVLLLYCMIPFIKIFGFNTVKVRLPMLLGLEKRHYLYYLSSFSN